MLSGSPSDVPSPRAKRSADEMETTLPSPCKRQLERNDSHGQSTPADASRLKVLDAERLAQYEAIRLWDRSSPVSSNSDADPPDQVFLKDTWAPIEHPHEALVYEKMTGEFWAPDLWAHQRLDSNQFFYEGLASMTDWHIFLPDNDNDDYNEYGGSGSEAIPKFRHDIRVHLAIYSATIGVSLLNVKTPRELLVVIMHAMLGERSSPPYRLVNVVLIMKNNSALCIVSAAWYHTWRC